MKTINIRELRSGISRVRELLAQLGCDFAQGHLIAKAVPGDQLIEAIQRWRKPQ